jgi:hypothetical protein
VIHDDFDAREPSRHIFEHRHLMRQDVEIEHRASLSASRHSGTFSKQVQDIAIQEEVLSAPRSPLATSLR